MKQPISLQCPLPLKNYPRVVMAHGGGGSLMNELIEKVFRAGFESNGAAHDSSVFETTAGRMAFTTDCFVVKPLFFPGGDIGSLAVHGTVNDLAMSGARPLYLSVGMILEEGLEMEVLWQIVRSMKAAADAAGVRIITGDTKVVERGKGDGIFINTSGVGVIEHELEIRPESIRAGDAIVLSGDLGRHGMAIMASREGLQFDAPIESDSAALNGPVQKLLECGLKPHCLRDLTRGGLSSALNELVAASGLSFVINESEIPVGPDVAAACEFLGFDPLYVANEGRFAAILPASEAQRAVEVLRDFDCGTQAALIGKVEQPLAGGRPQVVMSTKLGTRRVVDMLSGEQLPRIC